MILLQRSAEIHSLAGLAEIIGEEGEEGAVHVLLDALENFFVAFVPAIDDDAGAVRFDAKPFQGQEAALEGPQRRHICFGDHQNHARHAQDGGPLGRKL